MALTRQICYDGDHDDRIQERIKAQAALEGPPVPWTPPVRDSNVDCWGKPIKLRKTRRSRSMYATNSRVQSAN